MNKILITLIAALSFSQAQASTVELGLELSNLTPMKGQHYEGWNIIDGKPFSTGRFSITKHGDIYLVDNNGKMKMKVGSNGEASFKVNHNHIKSELFVLTIEPNGDKDNGPSNIHVIGGNYTKGQANLSIAHGSSLGTSFNSATGNFILAAPTGGNFNQGVWFVNPSNGMKDLDLPTLPSGWAYEGWIVNTTNGKKFSTGIFKVKTGVDSDAAGPYAGPLKLSFPPVPGQDIVKSHVVLDDGKHAIVVTVEPYPDFDSSPYDIKILKKKINKGAKGMSSIELKNISDTAPTGTVHIH